MSARAAGHMCVYTYTYLFIYTCIYVVTDNMSVDVPTFIHVAFITS